MTRLVLALGFIPLVMIAVMSVMMESSGMMFDGNSGIAHVPLILIWWVV